MVCGSGLGVWGIGFGVVTNFLVAPVRSRRKSIQAEQRATSVWGQKAFLIIG